MEISETRATNNFKFMSVGENEKKILVSAIDDNMNTKSFCIVDKDENIAVCGPRSHNISLLQRLFSFLRYTLCGRLTPTLIEPNVFFRTSYRNSTTMMEIFEFKKGEFLFLFQFNLPFRFRGYMLNRKFMIKTEKLNNQCRIEIFNVENFLICSCTFDCEKTLRFIPQNNIVCAVSNDTHSFKINAVISFEEEIPVFDDNHPLKGVDDICVLDITLGANKFIYRINNELFKYPIDHTNTIISTPFDSPFPNIMDGSEIIRVFDAVRMNNYSYNRYANGFLKEWSNFTLLDNEIYTTEYDHQSGITNFYKMHRLDVMYMFTISSKTVQISQTQYFNSLFRFPIILDLFNNSVTLLHPSSAFENQVLRKISTFYDCNDGKWKNAFFIDEDNYCKFYINNSYSNSFLRPNEMTSYDPLFNNNHFASVHTNGKEHHIYCNNQYVEGTDFHHIKLVNNIIWSVIGEDNLTTHVLDQESGRIVASNTYVLNGVVNTLVVNPYYQQECFIQYNTDKNFHNNLFSTKDTIFCVIVCLNEDLYSFIEVDYVEGAKACFIDQGLLVYGEKIYRFDDNQIKNIWNCNIQGELYSPRPGIAVGLTDLKDFNVEMCVTRFNDGNLNETFEIVNVLDFLSKCEYHVFFPRLEVLIGFVKSDENKFEDELTVQV
ncbi:hypothetical protein PCE1_004413 [Barthelona sp. PCE]